MSSLSYIELRDIDPEDVGDVLLKVEKSFGFEFGDTELKDVKTFGELCDIILNKIQGDNHNDCTTQQAFYKLRNAIKETLCTDNYQLTVNSELVELFPRKQRRRQIESIDNLLGFRTNVLRPKIWVTATLGLFLLASFIYMFIHWQVGLPCFIFSLAGLIISNRLRNEFDIKTLGQFAEKIARENYNKARRDSTTVNREEIIEKVKELFIVDIGLDKEALERDSAFA